MDLHKNETEKSDFEFQIIPSVSASCLTGIVKCFAFNDIKYFTTKLLCIRKTFRVFNIKEINNFIKCMHTFFHYTFK